MERKVLPMELTISKISSNYHDDCVRICLNDIRSSAIFANVEVSFETFARALTGQGALPCEVEFYPAAPIGKWRQSKREWVPVPDRLIPHEEHGAAALYLLASFEVDGWRGNVEDLFNRSKWNRQAVGPDGLRAHVLFTRYVNEEEVES